LKKAKKNKQRKRDRNRTTNIEGQEKAEGRRRPTTKNETRNSGEEIQKNGADMSQYEPCT